MNDAKESKLSDAKSERQRLEELIIEQTRKLPLEFLLKNACLNKDLLDDPENFRSFYHLKYHNVVKRNHEFEKFASTKTHLANVLSFDTMKEAFDKYKPGNILLFIYNQFRIFETRDEFESYMLSAEAHLYTNKVPHYIYIPLTDRQNAVYIYTKSSEEEKKILKEYLAHRYNVPEGEIAFIDHETGKTDVFLEKQMGTYADNSRALQQILENIQKQYPALGAISLTNPHIEQVDNAAFTKIKLKTLEGRLANTTHIPDFSPNVVINVVNVVNNLTNCTNSGNTVLDKGNLIINEKKAAKSAEELWIEANPPSENATVHTYWTCFKNATKTDMAKNGFEKFMEKHGYGIREYNKYRYFTRKN